METIGSKRSYALTRCMPNNDDDDDDDTRNKSNVFYLVTDDEVDSCSSWLVMLFCVSDCVK